MGYRHTAPTENDGRRLIPKTQTDFTLKPDDSIDYRDRYRGTMVGTGIGDALGRAVEGWSPRNVEEVFGTLRDFQPWRGWAGGPTGTITDDTEMALCMAQSFTEHRGLDPDDLANRFRAWARVGRGMGSATRAACRRLRDGTEWYQAGSESAGNGAAMRSAPVGLLHPMDMDALRRDAAASAVITHADPTAAASAIILAASVAHLLNTPIGAFDPDALHGTIRSVMADVADPSLPERRDPRSSATMLGRIGDVFTMQNRSLDEIVAFTYNGAFVLESLPATLAAFLASPEDPERVIVAAVNAGHDADTVGAMAGALAGAYHGASAFPQRWLDDLEFRSGLEGVADELCHLAGLGPRPMWPTDPKPDEYAPFADGGRRWITSVHHDSATHHPEEAEDIRVMPHPTAARNLVR